MRRIRRKAIVKWGQARALDLQWVTRMESSARLGVKWRENSLLRLIQFAEHRADAEEIPISKIKTDNFDSVLTC
ncbi:hypothetical protein E2C01_087529 [Portunus trituberculatus]|uniref:Uncharacterized protein n=1 Tax=Portunus trituberculatus TaxID=210409 RepID=A0A5B7JC01_PORTR|nr:hypothetical protein [Portunus trituberculatus]